MQLVFGQNEVPPGIYRASFAGVEPVANDRYGAGLRWKFAISDGKESGQVASRITSTVPTARNSCGAMLRAICGRKLERGNAVNIDAFKGKDYEIVVVEAEGGGTRVENVLPPRDEKVAE